MTSSTADTAKPPRRRARQQGEVARFPARTRSARRGRAPRLLADRAERPDELLGLGREKSRVNGMTSSVSIPIFDGLFLLAQRLDAARRVVEPQDHHRVRLERDGERRAPASRPAPRPLPESCDDRDGPVEVADRPDPPWGRSVERKGSRTTCTALLSDVDPVDESVQKDAAETRPPKAYERERRGARSACASGRKQGKRTSTYRWIPSSVPLKSRSRSVPPTNTPSATRPRRNTATVRAAKRSVEAIGEQQQLASAPGARRRPTTS